MIRGRFVGRKRRVWCGRPRSTAVHAVLHCKAWKFAADFQLPRLAPTTTTPLFKRAIDCTTVRTAKLQQNLTYSNGNILCICSASSSVLFCNMACKYDVNKTGAVQRRFTKKLHGFYKLSYENRLSRPGLESLMYRRVKTDLVMRYCKYCYRSCQR